MSLSLPILPDTDGPGPRRGADELARTVIAGGYCVGCGACAAVADSPFEMRLNSFGQLQATLTPAAERADAPYTAICPFGADAVNEDVIADGLFAPHGAVPHPSIGRHLATYAGHVNEGEYRDRGSSGGMGSWVLAELLRCGHVDTVINVQRVDPTEGDPRLFKFEMATTDEQVLAGAKSRYYPVEMSQVLAHVRQHPGRYAIVGVPCFLKAVRLLARYEPALSERIVFCVGLVCGHLKSTRFGESFGWQMGIHPRDLKRIDFRHKLAGRPANQYGVEATGLIDGQMTTKILPTRELAGSDWGVGYFKYKACDFCDDVLAETADLTIGDAWLPQYVADSRGTNIVIVRHPVLHEMVRQAMADGRLSLEAIDADEVARSQNSGLRHRRDGLQYRLLMAQRRGEWHPPKRVPASAAALSPVDRRRHEMRERIRDASHRVFALALERNDLNLFLSTMARETSAYRAATRQPLHRRVISRLRSMIKKVAGVAVGRHEGVWAHEIRNDRRHRPA
jgi:coenzyme F420 hydrogenase subunit beta